MGSYILTIVLSHLKNQFHMRNTTSLHACCLKFLKISWQLRPKSVEDEKIYSDIRRRVSTRRKLPSKKPDSWCFSVHCRFRSRFMGEYLCYLGSSIDIMPLSTLNKLFALVKKPTNMVVGLVDRWTVKSHDTVEDVILQIDRLKFLVDFIILEIDDENDTTFTWETLSGNF